MYALWEEVVALLQKQVVESQKASISRALPEDFHCPKARCQMEASYRLKQSELLQTPEFQMETEKAVRL